MCPASAISPSAGSEEQIARLGRFSEAAICVHSQAVDSDRRTFGTAEWRRTIHRPPSAVEHSETHVKSKPPSNVLCGSRAGRGREHSPKKAIGKPWQKQMRSKKAGVKLAHAFRRAIHGQSQKHSAGGGEASSGSPGGQTSGGSSGRQTGGSAPGGQASGGSPGSQTSGGAPHRTPRGGSSCAQAHHRPAGIEESSNTTDGGRTDPTNGPRVLSGPARPPPATAPSSSSFGPVELPRSGLIHVLQHVHPTRQRRRHRDHSLFALHRPRVSRHWAISGCAFSAAIVGLAARTREFGADVSSTLLRTYVAAVLRKSCP